MTVLDVLALASVLGLAGVWVVYPLAMSLLARWKPRAASTSSEVLPAVSIVIATRDEPKLITRRVENCLRSDYPADRLEIVIARDARSRHGTEGLVETHGARVIAGDQPGGKAATLNAGVREASGDIIVFADTGQEFTENTVSNLVKAFLDPAVGAVTGALQLSAKQRSLVAAYWFFERWLRRCEAHVHSSVGATGAVYAIRKRLWKPLRAGLILDDVFTPMQIVVSGSRVAFADDAVAMETRQPSTRIEYGRKVRTLTGVMQLCAWYPQVLVPVRNPIWLQFVFHKLLRMLTPYWLALIAVAVMVRSISLVRGYEAVVLAACALLALWVMMTRHRLGATIRRTIAEGIVLQAAVVVAGINGVRGRWQVWDA
jgi:cellulose synthase/poly-beta-1,6-N-acetylglucosamine synthase-like glycosyltransferase